MRLSAICWPDSDRGWMLGQSTWVGDREQVFSRREFLLAHHILTAEARVVRLPRRWRQDSLGHIYWSAAEVRDAEHARLSIRQAFLSGAAR